jgi:hypothetical protein
VVHNARDVVVLLLVDEPIAAAVLADRDSTTQGVLVVGDDCGPARQKDLLAAMGLSSEALNLEFARYHRICVVASPEGQARLLRFVAAAMWPLIERGWLWTCETPYSPARARRVSVSAARAALNESRSPG